MHPVIIDFGNVIKTDDSIKGEHTLNFASEYVAPEVNLGKPSPKSDIYSLAKIIQFIKEKTISTNNMNMICFEAFFNRVYEKCIDNNADNRPSISYLYKLYLQTFSFFSKSYIKMLQNDYFDCIDPSAIDLYHINLLNYDKEFLFDLGQLFEQHKDSKKFICC